MKKRRDFLKASTLAIGGTTFLTMSDVFARTSNGGPIVKQAEQCETYWVRENTPITFHISKTTDHVAPVSLLSEELVPGGIIPVHKHLNEDEFFFFVSGTGTVTIDQTTSAFKPGTTAFIPRNTWHSLKNTGIGKAFFYFGYSPSGFEDFFKEIGTPKNQPFKAKAKDEFDRIAKKYGMVFQ